MTPLPPYVLSVLNRHLKSAPSPAARDDVMALCHDLIEVAGSSAPVAQRDLDAIHAAMERFVQEKNAPPEPTLPDQKATML